MTVIDAARRPPRDEPGGQQTPSPCLPERLKALRTEAGWSRAELAARIDSDGRQVSRHEKRPHHSKPRALVRIAESFNVSVDHLVVDDAPRRPLHSVHNALADKLADHAALDPDDQAALLKVLDALVMKHKLQALTGEPAEPPGHRPTHPRPAMPEYLIPTLRVACRRARRRGCPMCPVSPTALLRGAACSNGPSEPGDLSSVLPTSRSAVR